MKTYMNKSIISTLLVFSMIFSSLVFTAPSSAAITKDQVTNVIKWGTIAGVAAGAVIGAATLGLGGLVLGAGVGALVTTFVSSRFGVTPSEQWKLVFPNGIFPFNLYQRTTQTIGNSNSLPSASQVFTVDNMNKTAREVQNTYNSVKAKYNSAKDNVVNSTNTTMNEIKTKYEATYTKYINAVSRGKNSAAVQSAKAAYLKAKAKFEELFNK